MITRRLLLFIGSLMLFIDDDESQIFKRGEDGAARANHDARLAGIDLMPFVVTLAF